MHQTVHLLQSTTTAAIRGIHSLITYSGCATIKLNQQHCKRQLSAFIHLVGPNNSSNYNKLRSLSCCPAPVVRNIAGVAVSDNSIKRVATTPDYRRSVSATTVNKRVKFNCVPLLCGNFHGCFSALNCQSFAQFSPRTRRFATVPTSTNFDSNNPLICSCNRLALKKVKLMAASKTCTGNAAKQEFCNGTIEGSEHGVSPPTQSQSCVCANVMDEIRSNEASTTSSFKPKKVLVLTKLTRLEFERRTNAQSNEEELKDLLTRRGSDYTHLLDRHTYHHKYLDIVIAELEKHGIECRVVQRFEYTDDNIDWADAVFTAGGDGTFLLAASRIHDPAKPVIGINTDPVGSEGYMCLMDKLSYAYFPAALHRLLSGDFQWMWRQRIRITMIGPDAWEDPVELHNQQLLHPEHRWLDHIRESEESNHSRTASVSNVSPSLSRSSSSRHRQSSLNTAPTTSTVSTSPTPTPPIGSVPRVLPFLALNEVYMGESVSSRVSYFEFQTDEGKTSKQKNSGVTVCTGTGSTSWYFNINRMTNNCVAEVLKILNEETNAHVDVKNTEMINRVCERFNQQLLFSPSELRMAYTIRDPVNNSTFHCDRPRGFIDRAEIKSRCFDAHLVVDGGMSFSFNNGTRAILEIRPRDALRTVIFR